MPLIRLKKVMVENDTSKKEQFEAKSVAHAVFAIHTYIYVVFRHTARMIAAQTLLPNQALIGKGKT